MLIVAVLRQTEQLLVFAESETDDRIGPYQTLAGELLARPEEQVRWMAEDPTGRHLIDVPAAFIQALLDVERAGALLREALAEHLSD